MAYTKQTWATGDTVTAAKLNHMEDGISGGSVLVVHVNTTNNGTITTSTLDKTYEQITAAPLAVCHDVLSNIRTKIIILDVFGYDSDSGKYYVSNQNVAPEHAFTCSSVTDYPSVNFSSDIGLQ